MLPGTYINFESTRENEVIAAGTRGTAIIPLPKANYGPAKKYIKLTTASPDAQSAAFGYSIYDSDPNVNKNAFKYDELSYDKVLTDNLKAMDATAIALARDFAIEIVAYGKNEPHGLKRILNGEKLGTVVKNLK